MRLATYALPPTAQAERLHSAVSPGLFWAQFGNTILLYGDDLVASGMLPVCLRRRKGGSGLSSTWT